MDEQYSQRDRARMARALYLAAQPWNGCDPNPRVGCVIDKDGVIVGEGWHHRAGDAHAEIEALQQAGEQARGAVAYVSLEPCSHHGRTGPCTEALIQAGIRQVVYAAGDPNPAVDGAGRRALQQAGVEVQSGLLQSQASQLNRGFFSRHQRARPFTTTKIAASLDGRTALANGTSQWITGEEARHDVQRLRARASAILTGVGTVVSDDPRMTVRLPADPRWQMPLRAIADTHLRTPPQSEILRQPGEVIIFTTSDNTPAATALRAAGARLVCLPLRGEHLDLEALLQQLAEMQVNELLVEAGPKLNGALLEAGLLDEVVVYQAAVVLGSDAQPMFSNAAIERMEQRLQLDLLSVRRVGADWRLRLIPRSL